MSKKSRALIKLFKRDLNRMVEEVDQTPDDILWHEEEGIANSCGILAQHLSGNLNHFIGTVLGDTGYERDREREFTNTGISGEKLKDRLEDTREMIEEVVGKLDKNRLQEVYPLDLPWDYTVYEFLLHLYGHLNYHRGQFNYLRRISEQGRG